MMNNLLILLLLKSGLPGTVTQSLGGTWNQTIHHIKTAYGTSEITYGSTPKVPLFCLGQGSTCGPIFWLLCFCLIVDSIDPNLAIAIFISACSTVQVSTVGSVFVYDTSYQHLSRSTYMARARANGYTAGVSAPQPDKDRTARPGLAGILHTMHPA